MRPLLLRRTVPAVAALAALAFLPALWAGFAADDYAMLSTVEALDGPLWAFERNDLGQVDGGHFYRPLWVLLNAAALELGSGDPLAFHAINLALYALIAVEVLLLVRALAGRRAVLAAAAFAVYPRHAESVVWASGNTDLLATAIGLAALLCALAPWPERRRMLAAAGLTALATLAKESAFVLPVLAALALWLREPGDAASAVGGGRKTGLDHAPARQSAVAANRALLLRLPAAMALALVPVFVVRMLAIDGLGGYDDGPPSAAVVLGSFISYATAAVTPHQIELLRHPVLAVVPLAVVGVAGAAAWRLHARGERSRLRTFGLGLAWFAVALVPVLGEPLDLNNATGERLLFLPSVGLALLVAALAPDSSLRQREPRAARRHGRRLPAAAAPLTALAALGAAAGLSVASATNWVTATDLARRTLEQALSAAPASRGELVLLSIPDSYRNAHVFTNSFDRAVERGGRPDLRVSWCAPVHVRDERPRAVRFEPRTDRTTFLGRAEPSAPFDFPVLGDPQPLSPGCAYERASSASDSSIPGLGRRALVLPRPERPLVVALVFDGRDLRRLEVPGSRQAAGLDGSRVQPP